jgi:hypothetical protein
MQGKKWLLLLVACGAVLLAAAQKNDKALEEALLKMTQGFKGDIGFYIKKPEDRQSSQLQRRYGVSHGQYCKSAHPGGHTR